MSSKEAPQPQRESAADYPTVEAARSTPFYSSARDFLKEAACDTVAQIAFGGAVLGVISSERFERIIDRLDEYAAPSPVSAEH